MDRYNHDMIGGDDTDEQDDSPIFGSFSSYSPQYRKTYYSTSSPSSTSSSISSTSIARLQPKNNSMSLVGSDSNTINVLNTTPTACIGNAEDSLANSEEKCGNIHHLNKFLTTPELHKFNVCATIIYYCPL